MALAIGSILLVGCVTSREYELSPIAGVVEIDVRNRTDRVGERIVDKNRVSAILAFLNARRDHWYDPKGQILPTTADLYLLGPNRQRIASIAFGPGGMAQRRAGMTYRDSVAQRELILLRDGPSDETAKDAAILCGLLGPKLYNFACVFE